MTEPQTRLVEVRRTPVQAIEAFEGVYRSNPKEFATIGGVSTLTPEARRMLASLLTLSAPAREALAEVLQLDDEVREVVLDKGVDQFDDAHYIAAEPGFRPDHDQRNLHTVPCLSHCNRALSDCLNTAPVP